MKHGNMQMRGGGGDVVAFTRSTDGAGLPSAASATTHFGSPAGAITITRTGAGVYRFAWSKLDYGTNLAAASFSVALAGDWTSLLSIDRDNARVDVTFKTGGVATDIVSGAISALLVFGPQGY